MMRSDALLIVAWQGSSLAYAAQLLSQAGCGVKFPAKEGERRVPRLRCCFESPPVSSI